MSNSAISYSAIASTKNKLPKLRLDYLDGLRGLSALYVVLLHVTDPVTADNCVCPNKLPVYGL